MSKNTLTTISEATGFSVSTVSRVLSGKGRTYRISDRTIALIMAEAEKCHYTPDLIAKSLKTNHTDTVGLTVPNIDNPFFANLASVVMGNLKQHDYHVLLADSMESEKEEKEALAMFVSRKVDGIIAVPIDSSPARYEQIAKDTPVVLIDRYFEKTTLPYICTDNYTGSRMATDYLIRKGYRNILAIQGVQTALSNRDRAKGFLDAAGARKDLSIRTRIAGNAFSVENGYRETLNILKSGNRPDAIYSFSSTILLGSIMALREQGIRIPGEIGLISFDNNGFLDYLDPAITRVEQPLAEIGRKATEILFDLIGRKRKRLPEPPPVQELLKPTLIVRDSC